MIGLPLVGWMLLAVARVLMQGECGDLTGATPENRRLAMFAVSVPLAILCPVAAGVSWLAFTLMAAAFFFVALVGRSIRLALGVPYIVVPVMALLFLRSAGHTSELQSIMRNSFAVFCLKKKK